MLHRRPCSLLSTLTFSALLLWGCQELPAAQERGDALPPADDLSTLLQGESEAVPTLLFLPGWTQRIDNGPLLAGQPAKISYFAGRMPTCRGTHNGYPAWMISAFYRALPDLTVRELQLGHDEGQLTRPLTLPQGTRELELWFRTTNISGCEEWDSVFGANYRFPVSDPALETVIRFDASWNEIPSGPIVRGGTIRLDYSAARLPECRATYHGGRTWSILASYLFHPGGQSGAMSLNGTDYYALDPVLLQPAFSVPLDATEVEIWFLNNDRAGCSRYDSNFGANYRFPVEGPEAAAARVQWGGDWNFVGFHRERQEMGDVDPAYYWASMAGAEYATWIEAEIWAPGITDRAYDSDEARRLAATERITAQVWSDAIAGTPGAEQQPAPLRFERQDGNNFVYSWRLADLFLPPGIGDGLYSYRFHFSTNGGGDWFTVARPDGSARRVVLAREQRCDLFPDNPPEGCPRPDLAIGWAGDWGTLRTHGCTPAPLENPVIFQKSEIGRDCMVITADVWVPEFTERNGDHRLITAQVITDLGYGGGPAAEPMAYDLQYAGRVGNNYRYHWNLVEHVARADLGTYRYTFAFSMDGQSFYTIGTGDGPGGGEMRTLLIEP